jgi:hypothetical protein
MEPTRGTLRYTGSPALAASLAQSLRDQGVDVRYEPPSEMRGGVDTMAEAVAVYYFLKGSDAALKLAFEHAREKFGRVAKIEEVDDEGPED